MTPSPENPEKSWRSSLPFPPHWLWTIAAKLIVLALVAVFTLKYYGLL